MRQKNHNRPAVTGPARTVVIILQKAILGLARYWFLLATLLAGTVLALGFLAPALMAEGYPSAGQAIYRFLAPHNHQLPQRSYFLFGQTGASLSYSREQVLQFGANPNNLQAFVGNAQVGYKTALNQRMIAIFIGIFGGGLLWGVAGQRPRLKFVWFLAMTLPLIFDGLSHMVSENSGEGFRQSNAWAVSLTGGIFADSFYAGTTIGSLNWWLRALTGLLFGLGLAWYLYAFLAGRFLTIRVRLEPKLRKAGAID